MIRVVVVDDEPIARAGVIRLLSEDADFVMVGTAPGSGSYRNVSRLGFQIAFSQLSLRVPTA